ncbi:SET domain-containing protein [Tricholoma matsutake]|nr:SET domain-containing protein [Tricholoma matsutake 945]
MSSPPLSWSSKDQKFVVHIVSIQPHNRTLPSIECSILLDSRMVPLLPKSLVQEQPPLRPVFEIKSAGGKGAGMFATQNIPAGALILVEHPVIVVPASIPFPDRSGAFRALVGRLPPAAHQELMTMANCRSLEECCMEEGIARTNGTALDFAFPPSMSKDPEVREYGGVFLKVNRTNHSCGPNAAHRWDFASFSSSLYALRPITAGEEITMMYTDISASREVRREKLRRLYGFDCECTYCDLPDKKAVAHSDLSRAKLRDWPHINPGYLKWSTDLCRADDVIIKSHQEALALIEQEGMYALRCLYMEEIMLSYALLGEEAQFRDWAQKLLNLCAFQDPALAADVRTWLKNPRLMKKWAWRKKHRLHFGCGNWLFSLATRTSSTSSSSSTPNAPSNASEFLTSSSAVEREV